ncbi:MULTISPECIES: ABC transporter permease [Paenibacillus]|uniref:ABC transporter permease n=1 Tax=Paenibacillus TaxID=44249 RepID=UPI000A3F1743|nr:ABC transporter permease [Paenibacillus odorifer]
MRFSKKRLAKFGIVGVISLFIFYAFFIFFIQPSNKMKLELTVKSGEKDYFQVYFLKNNEQLNEEQSVVANYNKVGKFEPLKFPLDDDVQKLRLDLGTKPGDLFISNISISSPLHSYEINMKDIDLKNSNQVENLKYEQGNLSVSVLGEDPYIEFVPSNEIKENIIKDNQTVQQLLAFGIALLTAIIFLVFVKLRSDIKYLFQELYYNKKMLYFLSVNDFKTKYAGSYLGVIWAFVQPVVTVLIYWFVFEVGFRSGSVHSVPFILWLVAGIVPWFFFAEAWGSATNCLMEYSYLVKKIVFQIRLLPLVKITSSFFVHLFFVILTFIIFLLYGVNPSMYATQVVYYSLCTICFVFSLSLISSSLIVFFKDLGQIISLILQFGMWLTPILWSSTMLPASYRWILKVNPVYYIVEGYRDALINKVWFWERYNQSIYFWLLTSILFLIGITIMKRMKPHFADVL